MRPTQHISNNRVLGAPAGWDQQQLPCNAVAITVMEIEGLPLVKSYWRPTEEELAALNAGGLVALSVVGSTMPPVALDVE